MSQENVEIVKEVYARGERGDFDGMLALWHPVAEWIEDPRVPGASTYRGYAEIKRYMEGARRFWGETRSDIDRFVDLGDHVLALTQLWATQRGGPEITRPFDVMFTLRDRQIVRAQWFSTRNEALEAAGLSE